MGPNVVKELSLKQCAKHGKAYIFNPAHEKEKNPKNFKLFLSRHSLKTVKIISMFSFVLYSEIHKAVE